MELEKTPYPTCFMSNSNSNSKWFSEEGHYYTYREWTREENKKFESALAIYDKDTPDRWLRVAAMLPGKTVYDVIKQYRELEQDVCEIEAGRVPVPGYDYDYDACRKKPSTVIRSSDQDRKKGVPWTEEEHRRFLMGLLKYGKGDWRNISRSFVVTKTPTQVASHAQKYYIRQKLSGGKDNKRRPSIHDITILNHTSDQEKQPLLFNDEQQKKLTSMPNYDMFMLQGQEFYECAFHETYAKLKNQGFRTASRDFNKEAIFGIHAL